MRIETARLLIRDIVPQDVSALARLWADPDVTRHMGGPRDEAELRAIFEEDAQRAVQPEVDDLWPVVETASGRVVGHCGLLHKEVDGRPEVELVYVFEQAVWGQGYATEAAGALADYAFQGVHLQRVIAPIDPNNVASERVAQKIGMCFERAIARDGGAVRRVYALEATREGP
mgnify:CR=1 FL=1